MGSVITIQKKVINDILEPNDIVTSPEQTKSIARGECVFGRDNHYVHVNHVISQCDINRINVFNAPNH